MSSIKQTTESNELQISELQVPIGNTVKVEVTELFSWNVIAVNVIDSYDNMSVSLRFYLALVFFFFLLC